MNDTAGGVGRVTFTIGYQIFFWNFTASPRHSQNRIDAAFGGPMKITKNKPLIQFKGRFVNTRHIMKMNHSYGDEALKISGSVQGSNPNESFYL